MSIHADLIGDCVRAGRLYRVPSLLSGASQARSILATPQLMAGLTGTGAEARRRMVVELRADLDTFIMGMAVTVGGPRHNAYMKPLARTRDERGFSNHEVWEIRSLDPEPSIRVFGRFAMKDVFVATDWELRTSLGAFGSLEWRREIRRCKSDWRKLFDTRALILESLSMTTSLTPSSISEIPSDSKPTPDQYAYFGRRFRNDLHDEVLRCFLREKRERNLTKAELARRLGKDPALVTRWLGAPKNLTLETIGDLLLAMGYVATVSTRRVSDLAGEGERPRPSKRRLEKSGAGG